MMDRLLTAGLCGNTIGQDIQTLTYHSSTSNMAFHLKDVCSSNFTLSRYDWEAKTQMQKMGFILNITENKYKSNHPEGENQKLYKHTPGKSREQAEQGSRQT